MSRVCLVACLRITRPQKQVSTQNGLEPYIAIRHAISSMNDVGRKLGAQGPAAATQHIDMSQQRREGCSIEGLHSTRRVESIASDWYHGTHCHVLISDYVRCIMHQTASR